VFLPEDGKIKPTPRIVLSIVVYDINNSSLISFSHYIMMQKYNIQRLLVC